MNRNVFHEDCQTPQSTCCFSFSNTKNFCTSLPKFKERLAKNSGLQFLTWPLRKRHCTYLEHVPEIEKWMGSGEHIVCDWKQNHFSSIPGTWIVYHVGEKNAKSRVYQFSETRARVWIYKLCNNHLSWILPPMLFGFVFVPLSNSISLFSIWIVTCSELSHCCTIVR